MIQIKQRNEPSELCKPSYGSGLRGRDGDGKWESLEI